MKVYPVVVAQIATEPEEMKEQLHFAADCLAVAAAECHAEGMSLAMQSARVEQLANITTEKEMRKLYATLVDEGLISADGTPECTSKGGEA